MKFLTCIFICMVVFLFTSSVVASGYGHRIKCYSGGTLIYDGYTRTGYRMLNDSYIEFTDSQDRSMVIRGDCVIKKI